MSRRQSCVTYLSQFSKFHLFYLFTSYFTYLSINLFIFNPQRLCDCIGHAVGNKFPIFPIGFFGVFVSGYPCDSFNLGDFM